MTINYPLETEKICKYYSISKHFLDSSKGHINKCLPFNQLKMKISLVIHGPEVIDSGEAKRVLEKLSRMGTVEAIVKLPIPFFSLSNVVCFEDLQALEDVSATIRRGRSDQGSSPWSRPSRSPGQTSSARPRFRRPQPEPGAGSSNRRLDRHACRST